jgi:hypothetical protein
MRTKSRTASLLAATGSAFAVFAMIGAPAAVADPACPSDTYPLDGTCLPISSPLNNASTALGLPSGSVNDVVPSLNNGALFDNSYFDTEAEVALPGFNGNEHGGGGGGGHGGR